MTKHRKILVLFPPLLIGISLLLVFFTIEHRQQLQNETLPDPIATSTDEVDDVTTPTDPSDPNTPVSNDEMVVCTMDAKQCPDGSFVGRTGPNCEFAACPGENDPIPQDTGFITCPAGSRAVDACIEIYQPVCAAVEVQCVTTPCDPVQETYPNSCFACIDEQVIGYTAGSCDPAV